MGLVDIITEDDTDVSEEIIKKEYGMFTVFSGIYPNLKPGVSRIIGVVQLTMFTIFVTTNTVALGITVYLTLNDATVATQTLHFIVMNLISCAILFSFTTCRREFARLHNEMGQLVRPYDQATLNTVVDLRIEAERKQKVFYIALPAYIGVAGMLIVFLGPVTDYFFDEMNKNIYSEGGVSLNLPIPCWSPFGSDTTFTFIISLCFQAGDHFVIVSTIVTANCIMIVMTKHIYTELNLLISAINRLPERAINVYFKKFNKQYTGDTHNYKNDPKLNYCYNECIKENIRHHQRIIRAFNDMNTVWSKILMVFFFTSTLSIAMSGILLLFGNGRITTWANAILMGITEIFDVFVICWCGKMISEASENVNYALYKTKWFYATKESATYQLIMMANTKAPLTIQFNPINKLPADLATFTDLMNTAYSYFNLLYAFRQ